MTSPALYTRRYPFVNILKTNIYEYSNIHKYFMDIVNIHKIFYEYLMNINL